MNDTSEFKIKLQELGLTLSEQQERQFLEYYEMLVEKNKVVNLTAITEFKEVIDKHFVDSLYLCKMVDITKELYIVDIGTGAGFPGIPLKIMFPWLKIDLVDSLNKRVVFLNEVIEALELKDIRAFHGRAEDFGHHPEFREKYDLCVSRAVANMSTLSEYCVPLIKVGGSFIAYKSGQAKEEVVASKKAIKIFGGRVTGVLEYQLPETDFSRTLIKVDKLKPTGKTYPRKAGMPAKEPIK